MDGMKEVRCDGAQHEDSSSPSPVPNGHDMTTCRIMNVPREVSQEEFLHELNTSGFMGLYDFCYMPRNMTSGRNRGSAFVNFLFPEVASAFASRWGNSQLHFQKKGRRVVLKVMPARIQGRKACEELMMTPQIQKLRSPKFRPFMATDWPRSSFDCSFSASSSTTAGSQSSWSRQSTDQTIDPSLFLEDPFYDEPGVEAEQWPSPLSGFALRLQL